MQRTMLLIGVAISLIGSTGYAATVNELLDTGQTWLVAQRESQQRVDEIAEKTRDVESEYRTLQRQIEGLQAYISQLSGQIDQQKKEIAKTEQSLQQATQVERQLLPLLKRMVDTYAKMVKLSAPFLIEERKERIEFLEETIARADVSVAEKFRQVFDAYMAELKYGSTIGAYNDVLTIDGQKRNVDVLRVGRIGLFYQTADQSQVGRWDYEKEQWVALDSGYRNGISEAIRVANQLSAPSLLAVPLRAPQNAPSVGGGRSSRARPNTLEGPLLLGQRGGIQ